MGGYRMTKVITIHPEGDINVCAKFHGNPSDAETFHSESNVNLMAVLEERGSLKCCVNPSGRC